MTLYPDQGLGGRQTLYTSSLIYALHLAADAGVDVINMSGRLCPARRPRRTRSSTHSRGCILVAAAGNKGGDENYAGRYSIRRRMTTMIGLGRRTGRTG